MNVTTSAMLTFGMVTAGRWSEGKGVELNIAIAAVVLGIGLSVLAETNEPFAEKVGLLVLLGAAFRYLPRLVAKAGYGRQFERGPNIGAN